MFLSFPEYMAGLILPLMRSLRYQELEISLLARSQSVKEKEMGFVLLA